VPTWLFGSPAMSMASARIIRERGSRTMRA
jgi:hypothetical protein